MPAGTLYLPGSELRGLNASTDAQPRVAFAHFVMFVRLLPRDRCRAVNFHTCEHLAGSLYTDRVFTRTNRNGSYHAALGEARVMAWLDKRHKWGFSEWRSTTYFGESVNCLTALIKLSPSASVAIKAGMVLDLLMLDNAMHSFNGAVASSRGRDYGYGGGTSVGQLNWLLGGAGSWDRMKAYGAITAVAFGIVYPDTASNITWVKPKKQKQNVPPVFCKCKVASRTTVEQP